MPFKREGDRIMLEMSLGDWEYLLLLLGAAADGVRRLEGWNAFWGCMQFVNELNRGNDDFTPYYIPADAKPVR